MRRLGVLVRQLPAESRLATALNDGLPVWGTTDHLLADLWALTARAHSEKDSLPESFDHPARAEMTVKAKTEHLKALKEKYRKRKAQRRQNKGR